MAGFYETLTLNNYKKAMSGEYTTYGVLPANVGAVGDNSIALSDQINNSINQNTQVLNGENHDTDADWFRKVGNSMRDLQNNVVRGFYNFFDAIGDFFMGAVGTVAGWFGNDELKSNMESAISYDWQSSAVKFSDTLNPISWMMGEAGSGWGNNTSEYLQSVDDNSLFGGTQFNNILNGVEQGLGQIIPAIATGGIVSGAVGAGTAAAKTANIVTQASLGFMQGTGRGFQTTINDGEGLTGKGLGYSLLQGLIQGGEQALSAGIGGTYSSNARNAVGQKVANFFGKKGSIMLGNVVGNIASIATDAVIDGGLDAIETAIDPALKQIYDDNALMNAYGGENWKETMANVGVTFLTSALTSTLMDTMKAVGGEREDYGPGMAEAFREKTISDASEFDKSLVTANEAHKARQAEDIAVVNKVKDIAKQVEAETNPEIRAEKIAELRKAEAEAKEVTQKNAELDNQDIIKAAEAMKVMKATDNLVSDDTKLTDAEPELETTTKAVEATPDNVEKPVAERVSENIKPLEDNVKTRQVLDTLQQRYADKVARSRYSSAERAQKAKTDAENYVYTYRDMDDNVKARINKETNQVEFRVKENGDVVYALSGLLSASDDASGRTVHLPRSLTKSNYDLYINTASEGLGKYDVETFVNSLNNKEASFLSYNNPDKTMRETYVESSDGARYIFKDGEFKGTVTKAPEWVTDENRATFERTNSLADNDARLIQQASNIGYVGKQSVSDFLNGVIPKTLADGAKVNGVDNWVAKIMTAYDLATTDVERTKAITGGVDEFLKKATFTIKSVDGEDQTIKASELMTKPEIDTLKNDFKAFLDENQKYTRNQKEIAELKEKNERTKAQATEVIKRMSTEYQNSLMALYQDINNITARYRNSLAQQRQYTALFNKYKNAGTNGSVAGKPYERIDPYIKQYDVLKMKNGEVTTDSLFTALTGKILKKGENGTSFEQNGHFIEYTEEALENAGLGALYDDNMKTLLDGLKSHYDEDGKYFYLDSDETTKIYSNKLSNDDSKAVTAILKRLNRMTNARDFDIRTKRKQKWLGAVLASEALMNSEANTSGVVSKLRRVVNSTLGFKSRMAIYFTPGSTQYNLMFSDPYKGHLEASYKHAEFMNDMNQWAKDNNIDIDKTRAEDLTFTHNGKEIKMKKGIALSLYLNSKSVDNYNQLKKAGWNMKVDNKTQSMGHIDQSFIDDLRSALSENELNFVETMFTQGYNGKTKDTLNKYTTEKYGYAMFDGTGYVHRQMGNLNVDVASSESFFAQRLSSLGAKIAVKRTNNVQPILISDIFSAYRSYTEQVAEFVSLDAVRELNTALNMRGSRTVDEDGNVKQPETLASAFDKAGHKDFLDNWIKAVNGIKTVTSGRANFLFNNATMVPLELNVGTYLKMYLDPLRLATTTFETQDEQGNIIQQRVGWKNVLKGIVSGFASRFTTNQDIATFRENSRFYTRANKEGFLAVNNAFSANVGRVQKLFSKPLEFANNDMMSHIVFPIMQQFAKANGFGDVGTESNTAEAINLFDTIGSSALSNGDSLDMSDLRAGRTFGGGMAGTLTKAVFGMYGGDNQRRMEQITDAVFGNSRSQRRVRGYETILEKYNGEVMAEYQERADKAHERVAKLNDELDKLKNDPNATKAQIADKESEIIIAEYKAKDFDGQTQALVDTLEDFRKQITFEKNVVQAKGNTAKKIGYVASIFVASALLETLINQANLWAKDKDDEQTMSQLLTDVGFDTFVDWIPYVGTFASAVRYNSSFTPLQFEGLNQTKEAFSEVLGLIGNENTPTDYTSAMYKALNALGYASGIPIKNFTDYMLGGFGNLSEWTGSDVGAKLKAYVKGYNSTYLKTKANSYLKENNLTKATEYTQANMALFKSGGVSWKLAREIAKNNVSVKDAPNVDQGTKDRFMDIYSVSNNVAERFISHRNYTSLDEQAKAKALNKLYEAYYNYADAVINKTEVNGTLAKALYNYYNRKTLTTEQRKLLVEYRIIIR